jgi:hypothetical protein
MRRKILVSMLAGALCGYAATASAELCKYVDDAGNVTYSDSSVKGSKKASCFESAPVPPPPVPQPARSAAPPPPSATAPPPSATASPGGLPNVDPTTQRRRDDSRRKILEDELAVEERALVEARKALSEGENTRLGGERNYQRYLDRVQGLKDRVAQHERNLGALRQELSNLR